MAGKLKELHQLIAESEDMTESAEVLAECNVMMINKRRKNWKNAGENNNANLLISRSIETIYDNAVPKRNSSLSEEDMLLDSSDELLKGVQEISNLNFPFDPITDDQGQVQPATHHELQRQSQPAGNVRNNRGMDMEIGDIVIPQPSTARGGRDAMIQDMVTQAENVKAKIFATPGKNYVTPAVFADKNYIVVSAHLDDNMIKKIQEGLYVDFGKLLPRDKIVVEEDTRLEMVVRNGRTFWSPVSNSVSINSFSRWEQAFRVFANIYTKANPARAAELIEYNHVIHTISLSYVWDNVYSYDREFRLHMARNPQHSWTIILQQAWSLRLRDRLPVGSIPNYGTNNPGGRPGNKIGEPCRHFNRGRCNYGTNCKYEHRCSYCFKYGHGAVNCRKASTDRDRGDRGPSKNNFGRKDSIDSFNCNATRGGNAEQAK